MADLKSVTVEYLRELARKHLGRGHGKLKTRKELLAALAKRVPGLATLAGLQEPARAKAARGARKAPAAVSAASRTEKPEEHPKQPAAPERPLPGDDEEKTPVHHPPRPAEVVNFPPKPRPGRQAMDMDMDMDEEPSPPAHSHSEQHAAEPLVEGFFVARMAGEQEAWRHHLTESQRRRPRESHGVLEFDERLGELPMDYEDDTVLLLPRDPHTLFVLWDFSTAARRRSLEGLESPRAVLRVYDDGDVLVRVVDVALESRSYYIHGMTPGRPYRVEAHFVGASGRSRRIGHSSNRVVLPPSGPSSDTSVRFLRMPAATRGASLEAVAATSPLRTAPIEEREYLTWRRVPLPGSGGFEDIPERRRERVGPGAPGEGAPGQDSLHVRRAGGSSEQGAGWRGPGGSSEQWAWSAGPSGSSERWVWSQGPAGSSEQWLWTYGPAGASEQGPWWARPPSSGQGRQGG